jgi:hypothetical protein
LQFTLARPQQLHNYSVNSTIIELAASYILVIVKNHPFIDGNKRVGFGVGILFNDRQRSVPTDLPSFTHIVPEQAIYQYLVFNVFFARLFF